MKFATNIVIFIVLNFGALAIGGMFTGNGVMSNWYAELNKAPWTPPGWVFGAAWTSIMICFTFFMTFAVKKVKRINLLIGLFAFQWILNVLWNPTFFYFQNILMGLIVIISLTILVTVILIQFWSELKLKSLFILPYLIWLIIATSLNAYILINN